MLTAATGCSLPSRNQGPQLSTDSVSPFFPGCKMVRQIQVSFSQKLSGREESPVTAHQDGKLVSALFPPSTLETGPVK